MMNIKLFIFLILLASSTVVAKVDKDFSLAVELENDTLDISDANLTISDDSSYYFSIKTIITNESMFPKKLTVWKCNCHNFIIESDFADGACNCRSNYPVEVLLQAKGRYEMLVPVSLKKDYMGDTVKLRVKHRETSILSKYVTLKLHRYVIEDVSVDVKLKDYNITNISQLIPTDPKQDIDKGYYLPITVSLINNTNKIKSIELGRLGAICRGYKLWDIEGNLRFVKRKIKCPKDPSNNNIKLKPNESYKENLRLFFPKSYLNRKLSFDIIFNETLYYPRKDEKLRPIGYSHYNVQYKPIVMYWSKRIVINKNAEAIKCIVKSRPSHAQSGTGRVTIIKEDLSMKDIPLNVRELMKKVGAQNTGL